MANENFIDREAEIVVKKFPIVCVAGSAGRPDASVRLLQHLPRHGCQQALETLRCHRYSHASPVGYLTFSGRACFGRQRTD